VTLIAVRDKRTGQMWTADGGMHADLVVIAERELGLTSDGRFDEGYVSVDGFFTREKALGPNRLCKFHAGPPLFQLGMTETPFFFLLEAVMLQPTALPHDAKKAKRFADIMSNDHVFDPIEVVRISFANPLRFLLKEGRHRYEAAKLLRLPTILAVPAGCPSA
jgi:hypothetical protein